MSESKIGFFDHLLGPRARRKSVESVVALPLEELQPGSAQPRTHFDDASLAELADSIREHGVLQPVLVRQRDGYFEIVAGERRCRAARLAGLVEVPALVRELSDYEAHIIALLENLQREDLNPVEETEAVLELLALRLGGTPQEAIQALEKTKNGLLREPDSTPEHLSAIEEVFTALGRNWQSFLRNQARLVGMPEELYRAVSDGKLAYTKALMLAKLDDASKRRELLEKALNDSIGIRDLRESVRNLRAKYEPDAQRTAVTERYKHLGILLKRSSALEDRKRGARVLKLLEELEQLLADGRA